MGKLTEGLDGPLPIQVLQQTTPEEHRANLSIINTEPGGLSEETIAWSIQRKQERHGN